MKEHTTTREFQQDVNKTKYINRHFNNYRKKGELKSRLLLNHVIMYFNVFRLEAAQRLLFFKIPPDNWSLLKIFLLLANRCPRKVLGVNGQNINVGNIQIEDNAKEVVLRELYGTDDRGFQYSNGILLHQEDGDAVREDESI
tara:strand:+ start:3510 stop:3935 length:426 start_codon:yes stop_codon:yes gene_type:complete